MLLGCSVCSGDKGVQFTTQQAAAANKLSRHGSGPEHVRNVCKLLGYEVPHQRNSCSAMAWGGSRSPSLQTVAQRYHGPFCGRCVGREENQ